MAAIAAHGWRSGDRPGVFVAVVGPSGAGKDTLIDYARAHLAGEPDYEFVRRVITRPNDGSSEDHDTLDMRPSRRRADGALALTCGMPMACATACRPRSTS